MTTTKYRYLHVLQGRYPGPHGWEDICQSEDRKEIRADRKSYRDNAPEYVYRIISRRERRECDHGRVDWSPVETDHGADGTAEVWQQGTCLDCKRNVILTYAPEPIRLAE